MIKTGNYLLLVTFLICLSHPVSAQEELENCEESWYFESANSGSEAMQFLMGACFEENENYTEAMAWYRKAAEQGGPLAQQSVGLMYYYGKGTPQNFVEAMSWVRKAAEQGLVEAQFNLANFYLQGNGTPQNYSEAMSWYRKAAEQGFGKAQFQMGSMYYQGKGTPQNYGEAMTWYRKVAERGSGDAQFLLGLMYYEGQGTPQNHEKCYLWSSLASSSGDDNFVALRDECAEYLTPESLQNAQKEAAKVFELYR